MSAKQDWAALPAIACDVVVAVLTEHREELRRRLQAPGAHNYESLNTNKNHACAIDIAIRVLEESR